MKGGRVCHYFVCFKDVDVDSGDVSSAAVMEIASNRVYIYIYRYIYIYI